VSLTVDAVTRIAKDAAHAVSPTLEVVGITLGGGASSDYVEILVNINGCRRTPCQIEVGAFRDVAEPILLAEIERKLRDHLASHGPLP
jgi:hypothetical protein